MSKAKPHTIATEKYQKKAGYMTKGFKLKRDVAERFAKSYKLKREVVEAFAEACEQAGVSQAGKLTELMKGFIEEVNKIKE